MAKTNIAQLTGKLYELLKDLEPEERQKAVAATLILYGDHPAVANGSLRATSSSLSKHSAKSFMDEKDPQNKGEMLAVAARFLELFEEKQTHTKEEIHKVFTDARRNFDVRNYLRDMKNARNQAGFFNKNTAKGLETLSYYGQNYVDALPDREAAKALKKPKTKIPVKKQKGNK